MIFKIFSPKNLAKIFAFFAQTTVSFCKNCDHNIVFLEKRHFWTKIGKNRRKLRSYVTSTPGANPTTFEFTATTLAL
jgi:hypothetical protein